MCSETFWFGCRASLKSQQLVQKVGDNESGLLFWDCSVPPSASRRDPAENGEHSPVRRGMRDKTSISSDLLWTDYIESCLPLLLP